MGMSVTPDASDLIAKERVWREAERTANLNIGSPLTPAAPLEQQIREVSEEVIRWAERLAERRRCSADLARALAEAEEMFAERSIRLTQLTEQHRAAGQGLNAVKQAR
jgi:hypothetical protein